MFSVFLYICLSNMEVFMDKDKSLMKENLTTMQIKELLEMLDVMKGKITGLEEELKERLIIEKLMLERKDDKKKWTYRII
ncbi:Uncharacterised protein [Actinobacillus pleuropneumoniae]|nr:Uncharacterised protein [Actinobacillus pleuropneumoniae]